jgi:hypothetical protein
VVGRRRLVQADLFEWRVDAERGDDEAGRLACEAGSIAS